MMGNENLKSGFYNEKFDVIENTVRSYADVKSNENVKLEDLEQIKQNAQSLLSQMMIENGLRDDDSSFISLDNEFFDESGVFSETKLGEYQKLMLQYYALNDVKCTFAGTTSSLTKISKQVMENDGIDYDEMLPIEIKRKHNKEEIRKITGKTPDATRIFIYPDNTISTQYIPKKAKIQLEKNEDKNEKIWNTGYDPNLKIKKKDWTSGFNSKNNWEYIPYKNTKTMDNEEQKNVLAKITDGDKDFRNINLIHATSMNESILMDPDQLLLDGQEERFYSISGELYGARTLDKESTINEIKKTLEKSGVEKLSGIVTNDTDENTVEYYKKNFNSYMDENTKFYGINDEKLTEKIIEIKKYIKENNISNDIIENYTNLVKNGKSGEELIENLIQSTVKAEKEENLNIFSNKKDMEVFVSNPEISEDEELKDTLTNLKVPEGKSTVLSNSIQNIVKNYKSLFKDSNMDKKELVQSAYKKIVKGTKSENLALLKITKEKKLGDFIEENTGKIKKTDIPSFKRLYKSENYNLDDEKEFD